MGTPPERKRKDVECDDLRGWDHDAADEKDHRLFKFIRPHQAHIALTAMPEKFEVVAVIALPPTVLLDVQQQQPMPKPDASTSTTTTSTTTTTTTSTAASTAATAASTAATTPGRKHAAITDYGDVVEAHWRTSELSMRGTFVNGEPVWGEVEYRNGMSYLGSLRGGVAHGFGTKRLGPSVYKGQFYEGMRHGSGLFLDARNFRLYAGTYVNDKQHGRSVCIQFCWSTKLSVVQHNRTLVNFEHGVLISTDTPPKVSVSSLCGLSQEEFLKLYREGEKAIEDSMVRHSVHDLGFDEVFWTPVSAEGYQLPI
jgi:hypothetical protein